MPEQLLSTYLKRAPDDEVARFVRIRGYYQLANQVGLWPATPGLVDRAVGLVTGLHWLPLEEQLTELNHLEDMIDFNLLQEAALPPVLALLLNSVHDLVLAHNLLQFLLRLYERVS